MTICVQCEHIALYGFGNNMAKVCMSPAIPLTSKRNPVSGELELWVAEYVTGRPLFPCKAGHPLCRDINHGDCPYYKRRHEQEK